MQRFLEVAEEAVEESLRVGRFLWVWVQQQEEGVESLMINCNPETVSTDYDTSDRLYFEPLTFEDVMSIVEKEKPDGVIVQFGGQTPLKLAVALEKAGVKIIGT